MAPHTWDTSGEAHEALQSAVVSYGDRVLSNPKMLSNLFKDLMPDSPREALLLVTAAESDVAGLLAQQASQQMDPDSAIRIAANSLCERRALDPEACMWATTEFARVLGYPPSDAPAGAPSLPGGDGESPEAVRWSELRPAGTSDGAPSGPAVDDLSSEATTMAPAWAADSGPSAPSPAMATSSPGWPSSGLPPGGQPPTVGQWAPPSGPSSQHRRTGALVAGVVGVAALVAYLAVAGVAHLVPFSKSSTQTQTLTPPNQTVVNPFSPATTTTPPTTSAPGRATLAQLLPTDVAVTRDCNTRVSSVPGSQGTTSAFSCTDSSLPNGHLYAYQFDNASDYQVSLTAYNKYLLFNTATAGTDCPPSNNSEGQSQWWNDPRYPKMANQILECLTFVDTNNNKSPAYIWTFPTQSAILYAQGAPNSTFDALHKWWIAHSGPA